MEQIKRVASALIILPPLVLFLSYAPPWLFLCLVLGVIGLSLREYFHILQQLHIPRSCVFTSGFVACVLAVTAYYGDWRWFPMMVFFSLVGVTISAIGTATHESSLFLTLTSSIFGVLFIGWGLSHLILLRHFPGGEWYILFLCAVVWVGDSSAMYFGKSFGHYKMAPMISPGKTWEGAVACVVGGVLTAFLSALWLLPHLKAWHAMLLGCGVALTAQLGDLGESIIKRYAGVKDSGALIPGHGGMLDRIDSILFAAPTLVYMLNVLLPVASP